MSIWKKKYTHAQTDLFHSEKGELSDCPQPNVSEGPLEITGAVRVRATQAAPCLLQFSFTVTSILFTMFDKSSKTMEAFERFTCDLNLLPESSRDFLEMMTTRWRINVT